MPSKEKSMSVTSMSDLRHVFSILGLNTEEDRRKFKHEYQPQKKNNEKEVVVTIDKTTAAYKENGDAKLEPN